MLCVSTLFFFFLSTTTTSLAFSTVSSVTQRPAASCLCLTPQQGLELVQASSNVYVAHKDEDDQNDMKQPTPQQSLSSSKLLSFASLTARQSLVKRLFHLPSYLRHPHPKAEGIVFEDDKKKDDNNASSADNVVYFPIVGFTYVKDAPGHSRPLSTCSNPSCRLHEETHHEPVYGWFHPQAVTTTRCSLSTTRKKKTPKTMRSSLLRP